MVYSCNMLCFVHPPLTPLFFGHFPMSWAYFDHSIWSIFHSGTPGAYCWKKSWKTSSSKKVRFQGWLKLAHFLLIKVWGFNYLGHFSINLDNFDDPLAENFLNFMIDPQNFNFAWFGRMLWTKNQKKLKSEKMPILANPEILPFLSLRFINLFFNFMSQKY